MGTPYRTVTALGDDLAGVVVAASPDTWQFGMTIDTIGPAILFVEVEPAPTGARAGFWLSTYGLSPERLGDTRERFGRLYRDALMLTEKA
jgi:hypothetical protein